MVIRGHTGAGNTFCTLYIYLYSISKIFYSNGAARMCHCQSQMGTHHWHSTLCLRGNLKNVKNPHHRTELDVRIIIRKK